MSKSCRWPAFALAVVMACVGCRGGWDSEWVNARVENRSGETVRLVEIDYPSASFGADTIVAGSTLQYRFQIRGTGPIKITYSLASGRSAHATGPNLADGQHGVVTIRLLPLGKSEFEADLKPAS